MSICFRVQRKLPVKQKRVHFIKTAVIAWRIGSCCGSQGSSQEFLDVATRLLEESWGLSFK